MIRKLMLILISGAFLAGDAFAERGEPMMAWPYFVQLDFHAYHGAMMEKCADKYPAHIEEFRDAISKWNEANMPAISEIRGLLKERIRVEGGLPEAQAEEQMRQASAAWTTIFLKQVSITAESEWKDLCTGKYANYTLRSLDFQKHRSSIVTMIPNFPVRQLRP